MSATRISNAGGFTVTERWSWTPARRREHIADIAAQRSPMTGVRLFGDKPIVRGRNARQYGYPELPEPEDCTLMRLALALLEQRGIDTRQVSHVAIHSMSRVDVHWRDGHMDTVTLPGETAFRSR